MLKRVPLVGGKRVEKRSGGEGLVSRLNICYIMYMARRSKRGLKAPTQEVLAFPEWGGKRKGAGRKPNGRQAGVSHLRRVPLASRYPVHVTMRIARGLPGLRNRKTLPVLTKCFALGKERDGFRIVHYGVMGNHVHLIVEGKSREALSRGMQGLAIRLAKALNRYWGRKGTVFADRYHDRILKTPREVRNAIVYVLRNARKHVGAAIGAFDAFTSALWFDGWKMCARERYGGFGPCPVADARTWLLRFGWRRHGLLRFSEVPAG